ncbi:MAG: glycosyl transferase family 2 [Polycyclovorans sp.]|nr:glycosyl transferase family 2 [Polycyclovorans sp.]
MTYSVIVPHYNDPARLARLLCSVPVARDDIEVIVVDDCSPDQPALDAVRARWPRVRWLSTPENGGAGVARNVGLDAACGHWLVFADSDDEFLPGAFETFDRVLRADDALVYFLAEAVQEVDGSPSVRSERMNELVTDYATAGDAASLQRLQLQHVNPVAKVYARAFIEGIQVRFDTVRHGEDVAFNVLAAVQAHHVRAEATAVYRVYRRTGSLTTDATVQDLLARLEVLGHLNDRLGALGVPLRMHAASYVARAVPLGPAAWIGTLRLMVRHKMIGATLRRVHPREVWRFLGRLRRCRVEGRRMGNQGTKYDARRIS